MGLCTSGWILLHLLQIMQLLNLPKRKCFKTDEMILYQIIVLRLKISLQNYYFRKTDLQWILKGKLSHVSGSNPTIHHQRNLYFTSTGQSQHYSIYCTSFFKDIEPGYNRNIHILLCNGSFQFTKHTNYSCTYSLSAWNFNHLCAIMWFRRLTLQHVWGWLVNWPDSATYTSTSTLCSIHTTLWKMVGFWTSSIYNIFFALHKMCRLSPMELWPSREMCVCKMSCKIRRWACWQRQNTGRWSQTSIHTITGV